MGKEQEIYLRGFAQRSGSRAGPVLFVPDQRFGWQYFGSLL